DRSVGRSIGPCAEAKSRLRSKQPRGACCPGPDDHEGADTEPDLASGFHVESRRRFPRFRRPVRHTVPAPPRETSVPIAKFASPCGTLSCELRNQRDTSKFLCELAGHA